MVKKTQPFALLISQLDTIGEPLMEDTESFYRAKKIEAFHQAFLKLKPEFSTITSRGARRLRQLKRRADSRKNRYKYSRLNGHDDYDPNYTIATWLRDLKETIPANQSEHNQMILAQQSSLASLKTYLTKLQEEKKPNWFVRLFLPLLPQVMFEKFIRTKLNTVLYTVFKAIQESVAQIYRENLTMDKKITVLVKEKAELTAENGRLSDALMQLQQAVPEVAEQLSRQSSHRSANSGRTGKVEFNPRASVRSNASGYSHASEQSHASASTTVSNGSSVFTDERVKALEEEVRVVTAEKVALQRQVSVGSFPIQQKPPRPNVPPPPLPEQAQENNNDDYVTPQTVQEMRREPVPPRPPMSAPPVPGQSHEDNDDYVNAEQVNIFMAEQQSQRARMSPPPPLSPTGELDEGGYSRPQTESASALYATVGAGVSSEYSVPALSSRGASDDEDEGDIVDSSHSSLRTSPSGHSFPVGDVPAILFNRTRPKSAIGESVPDESRREVDEVANIPRSKSCPDLRN